MALKPSKPAAKPAAAKPEKAAPPSSADALKSLVHEHRAEHFVYIQPKQKLISTGSLILDSLVKVRSGSTVRIVGKGAELGKSSEGFVLLDNYMRVMPRSKSLYFKAESRNTPEIKHRSGLKWVSTPEEWVEGTVFEYPVNTFEVMAETLETLLPQMHALGENLAVMLDSLDGLMLRSDRTKTVWAAGDGAENVKVAGVPLLTKLLFRRLGLPIVHYDVLFIVTGQYSADIKLDPYAPNVPRQASSAGGNAIAHQSDYVFEYQARTQKDLILENPKEKPDWRTNKTLGVYVTLDIRKSGTDVTGSRPRIPIRKGRVGSAIWVEREIVDMMVQFELLRPKPNGGSWLLIDGEIRAEVEKATGVKLPEQINGMNQAYALIEENPKCVPYLYDYFVRLNGGGDDTVATTPESPPAAAA